MYKAQDPARNVISNDAHDDTKHNAYYYYIYNRPGKRLLSIKGSNVVAPVEVIARQEKAGTTEESQQD